MAAHPAELKRANLTYDDLAEKLKKRIQKNQGQHRNKLAGESLPAAFFLACLVPMVLEGVVLEEI